MIGAAARIRTRLLWLAVVPATLVGLALGAYFTVTRLDDLRATQRALGATYANQLAAAAEYGLFVNNRQTLSALAAALMREPDVIQVTIRDVDGMALVALSDPEPEDRGRLALLRHALRDDEQPAYSAPVVLGAGQEDDPFAAEPIVGPRRIGSVEVSMSQQRLVQQQQDALVFSVALSAVLLLVATALALRIGASLEVPLRRIADTVRRVARGDLSTRIQQRSAGELGALERDVNRMADAIDAAQRDLQQRIEAATLELRQTLEAVEIKNVELDLARKRALTASRVKSEFLANMSHEIRTPMNAVVGFTDLLARTKLDGDQREYVAVIERSSRELLRLLDDVLNLSRIEAGKLALEESEFDVRELVHHVMVRHARDAYAKGIELSVETAADLPESLRGDAGKLQQIVSNLLHNAVKYTELGSVTLTLAGSRRGADGFGLRIAVADTGPGIAPADRERLFEAFTQLDSGDAQRRGGVGLGLAISRRLAEVLGGTLTLESELDRGSCFTVELAFRIARPAVQGQPKPLAGALVLLFEPDPARRAACRAALDRAGAVVLECERIDDFVAQAATVDPARPAAAVVGIPYDADLMLTTLLERVGAPPSFTLVVTLRTMDRLELRRVARRCGGAALPRYASPDALVMELKRALETRAGAVAPEAVLVAVLGALDPDVRRMVADELPEQRERLRALASSGDAARVRDLVHRVRGTGAFCRLTVLERLAATVEDGAMSGVLARADLDALARHMDEVASFARRLGEGGPPRRSGAEDPTEGAARLEGLRVLIADDNAINRELLLRMLAHDGAIGVPAMDATIALDLLAAGGFDIALFDIHLPGMSGIDAASKVRALPPPADSVGLVAITANALPEVRDHAFAVGFDDFLVKPVEHEHLIEVLEAVRDRRALRRAAG